MDDLPLNPTMDAIRILVGEEMALKLSKAMGGRRIRIPVRSGRYSVLSSILGLDAAEKISEAYGGMNLDVAISAGKRARILELRDAGYSVASVAAQMSCTERYVYQVCQENINSSEDTLPLFGH